MIWGRLYLFTATMIVAFGAALCLSPLWSAHKAVKTVEDYWAETALPSSAVEDMLAIEDCRASQRTFLACVNAVGVVGTRLGWSLNERGQWARLETHKTLSFNTEKDFLKPWVEVYSRLEKSHQDIDFVAAWRRLLELNQSGHMQDPPYLTGLAINGFLSVFRDPHTYILPEVYFREVVSTKNSLSTSLGAVFARENEEYYLRKVFEGSAAQKAGLQRGDWVLSINELNLNSAPPQRLSEILRSSSEQGFRFKIRRETQLQEIFVVCGSSVMPSVTWKRIDSLRPVGVLTINKFGHESCAEVKKALLEMNQQKMRGLLIDLRDNAGGQMEEAACMVSLFVGPEKLAFKIRYLDTDKDLEAYYGQERQIWFHKTAILINSGSASASEILAGSLRDHNAAILVGEKTFGKGSFQEGEVWSRFPQLLLFQTRGFYYLPSGYSPQRHGISPDITVNYRPGLNRREEDQYMHPLSSPQITSVWSRPVLKMEPCLKSEDVAIDDRQEAAAQSALFCQRSFLGEGDLSAQNQ